MANGTDPGVIAEAEAAFSRGYQQQREADAYYRAHPGSGFPVPAGTPAAPGISASPRGLGYAAGIGPVPQYISSHGPVSGPELPPPPDMTLPPGTVTGFTTVYPPGFEPAARQARHELVFATAGETAPPRRSLLDRILGRGR